MTTPPTPPLPLHPPARVPSPLHRALRAATKTPRRRARRPSSSPSNSNNNNNNKDGDINKSHEKNKRNSSNNSNNSNNSNHSPFLNFSLSEPSLADPSLSTLAISGSPPPLPTRPSLLKTPKDLRTRLRNFRPPSSPDRTRRRRDDLVQTLLTFPEYDAATVASLLDQYNGDYQRVRQTLEQASAGHIPSPPISDISARPAAAANVVFGTLSPRDASSPPSMGSFHVGTSVAATAPKGVGNFQESVKGSVPGRPRESLAADVLGGGKGRESGRSTSPRPLSVPWEGDNADWMVGRGGGGWAGPGLPSSVMPKENLGLRGRETGTRVRRREMRNSHPPVGMFGYVSDGGSVGSSAMGAGDERVGKLSGVKRRRSLWALTEASGRDGGEGVEGSGQGSVSPNSWESSETREVGGGGAGSVRVNALNEFQRNQSGLVGSLARRREPSEDDEGFVIANGRARNASKILDLGNGLTRNEIEFKGGRGGGKPLTDMEAYGLLLNRVERLEEALRAFMRESEEERKDLRKRVENGQFEQSALEQRHGEFREELDENHSRWAYTERYLDVMRREMSQAIGARQSTVFVFVKSTVINVFYYIMAYLVVPVFAFVIRALRDGYGWIRRRVRGTRNAEEEGT